MRELTIGIVAEGATDFAILEELIQQWIPGDHHFLLLQPELSATTGFGDRGAGWVGVQRFCEMIPRDWCGVQAFMDVATPKIDLLVIQIDGDVARKNGVECWVEELDIPQNADRLRMKIREWLALENPNPQVIYCLPFDNMETWVLCAFDEETDLHNPPDNLIERVTGPDYIISHPAYRRPHRILKRKSSGEPKKSQRMYRTDIIPVLIENWAAVKRLCTQAVAFEEDVLTATLTRIKSHDNQTSPAP